MPPLSLALAARPAALFVCSRPPAARSAAPQARHRTWGARWRRQSLTSSSGGSGDDKQAGPSSSAGGSSKQPQDSDESSSSSEQPADSPSGGGSTSSPDAGNNSLQVVRNKRGKEVPVPTGLEAQLAPLAEQCSCSAAALAKDVAAKDKSRQAGVLQHGTAVAAWLRSQGVSQAQLPRLLLRCPVLFSWGVEQRAGVLIGQLQGLGLTASEAVRCFEQQPFPAGAPTFKPAIAVLASLLASAAGSGSQSGEQLLGVLLRGQPAAVRLLMADAQTLQKRITNLLELGLSHKQIAAALKSAWALLSAPPDHLTALEAALQQELGAGRDLFAKLLCRAPRVASCSQGTVRERAQALAKVFGRQKALDMVDNAATLVTVNTCVWQTALAVMELCGLPLSTALATAGRNADALVKTWLAPDRLVNRLALQRCLQLTAGQVYERHAGYMAGKSAKRLAGRLLFLQHHGLLHLLVPEKEGLLQEWRRQHGYRADRRAPGEPPLVSLCDASTLSDAQFASLSAVQAAAGGLSALQAFTAQLEASPAWQELKAAAEVERARLVALLPQDLRQAAEQRQKAALLAGEGEEEE